MSVRLFLFWHDRLLAETLTEALHRRPGLVLIGCTNRLSQAVVHLRRHRAGVVLLEAHGPGTAATATRLSTQVPDCRILVYGLRTARAAARLVEAGAAGYVRRRANLDHLVRAIHAVYAGDPLCDLEVEWLIQERIHQLTQELRLDVAPEPDEELTPREIEVLVCLDRGLTNKEVARQLAIRPATAKNHVHNVVRKLGAANRHGAVRRGHALGLLGDASEWPPSLST